MLELMRRHAYSWGTRALLIFLGIVLSFWGITAGLFSQIHPVANVNGVRILPDQVDREANQLRQTLQQIYGANAPAVLKSVNLRQEALDRIIENELVAEEARHLGIEVTRRALEDKIATQSAFQRDGQFDFETYQAVLRDNGLLPTEYEASMRGQMIQDTLRQMVDRGVQVSEDEVHHAYDLRNQKIELRYVEVPYSQFTAKISPTSQQVADYYEKHREEFREPERAQIKLIHYEPLTLAARITPSDKEINDYYTRNLKNRFTHPDLVHAQHILIAVPEGASEKEKAEAKAKAENILRQLKSGGDFAKLAARYSDDPSNRSKGGDLGFFPRGEMIKPFEEAVFKMKAGEITLVETRFGYHLVKLDEFKPAHTDPLAEARPKIIEDLRNQAGAKLAREAIDRDLSAALGGASLEDIAKKRGLDVIGPPPFARGQAIQSIGADPKITDAAFTLDVGQVRAIPEQGAPFLIKLVGRTPSKIPPLTQIEAQVREAYIRATAEDDARADAQKLIAKIKNPADFDRLAGADKLEIHSTEPFERSTRSVPGIGEFPEVTDAAGLVPNLPGVINRVMEQSGNSYIFEVTARTAPSEEDWKAAEKSFTDEYLSERRAQAWSRLLDQLKSQAKIEIHTDQLGEGASAPSM
jgi:peptidyl-prolyl cis-trans isomerase D